MLMLRPVIQRHVVRLIRTGIRVRYGSTHVPEKSHPFRRPANYKPLQPVVKNAEEPGSKPKSTLAPYILGTLTVGIGFYITQLVIAANKPVTDPSIKELAHQKDVAARYDETADNFDSEVGTSEALMGINTIRQQLSRMCTGHVLEVSCGTGRNLGYYDTTYTSKVDSLTFIDLSKQMVEVCKAKWLALYATSGVAKKQNLPIRFLTGSALGAMPLAPGERKYDTIFQTMGLCSIASPIELVENMARHLNMENPDARILLLEHGRSYQEWLNNILDNSAAKHAEIHGCWFNRDIGALVEEAAGKSGLEVVKERRHHLGTTWVFELKPKGAQSPDAPPPSEAEEAERALDAEKEAKGGYGWRGLVGWNK